MPEAPPGLGWVTSCAQSLTRADDALSAGPLTETRDPLIWEFALRLAPGRKWDQTLKGHAKTVIQIWAQANDCRYVRSRIDGQSLVVVLIVKNPSSRRVVDPLESQGAPYRRR